MSILIKGMEMPIACAECPLYNGVGCKATGRMFAMFYNVAVRRDDCPLVGLESDDVVDGNMYRLVLEQMQNLADKQIKIREIIDS